MKHMHRESEKGRAGGAMDGWMDGWMEGGRVREGGEKWRFDHICMFNVR